MIPGGGLEAGETEIDCCIRETAEETGTLVTPSECFLEIDEYYEDRKWVNQYFICEPAAETSVNLTAQEAEVGLEARWIDEEDAKAIFSTHHSYAGKDEMRRGMYFREYTALLEFERQMKK